MDTDCESLWKKIIGKPCILKGYARFDEGELGIGYGCDNVGTRKRKDEKQQTIMGMIYAPESLKIT